jgi:nucleotide-binding universal stress UspA family protein
MIALERLLCPCDFSEASQHAIDHAIAIAKWSRSSITALHVYDPLFMPVPGLPGGEARVPVNELSRVQGQLEGMFERARHDGVKVDVTVEVGQPARQIVERARLSDAHLIVMGTHGAGGFEHLVLGSVAERVLRKAACPVLTVPPRSHAVSPLPFQKIVCAVDFSSASLSAWQQTKAFARNTGATIVAVTVIEWPWHEPPVPDLHTLPAEQVEQLAEWRRYLESSALDRLRSIAPTDDSTLTFVPRVVHGRAYEAILRVADEERPDLVVIGVHGRNVVDMALFGSTTNQVVRRAKCPVLTWREIRPSQP